MKFRPWMISDQKQDHTIHKWQMENDTGSSSSQINVFSFYDSAVSINNIDERISVPLNSKANIKSKLPFFLIINVFFLNYFVCQTHFSNFKYIDTQIHMQVIFKIKQMLTNFISVQNI